MFGIVITAYNRPQSLKNLLLSLSKVYMPENLHHDVPLTISIDNNGTEEVNDIANSFEWKYGEKEVIIHSHKKGLVNHFIWVGDQTEKYENVLFLEDDLIVSPQIIDYVVKLIDYYKDSDTVSAASLYNPVLVEATGTKFYQIEDGYDVYFIQHPYWGNVWFGKYWKKFKEYLKTYSPNKEIMPPNIFAWTESFKKIFIQFLIESHLTVVTPRVSLVTNNGEPGLHSGNMYAYQSNLQLFPKNYRFCPYDESEIKYDSFCELPEIFFKKKNQSLSKYEFDVDILGTREVFRKPFVLTTRPVRKSIMSFTSLMKPTELGVCLDIKGNQKVKIVKTEDVIMHSKKFVRTRRFLDILKNYHIGIYASIEISKYGIGLLFSKLKKLIRIS